MGQASRRNRKRGMWQRGVEGRQTLQYSWLALYVSHKLAGELPLSDSLTEHTLFPARIVSSLYLFPSRSYSLSLSLSSLSDLSRLLFLPVTHLLLVSENKSL